MQLVILFFVALLLSVLIGLLLGTIIVAKQNQPTEAIPAAAAATLFPIGWHIELWDIGDGNCFEANFRGGVTLGRGLPERGGNGFLPIGTDITISREQALIYDRNGRLVLWNMGLVNPTLRNGCEVDQPQALSAGDRLDMGGRSYLLTNISYA